MHIEMLVFLESGEVFDYMESKLKEKSINITRQELFQFSFTMKGISMATSMNYTYEDNFENYEEPDKAIIINH